MKANRGDAFRTIYVVGTTPPVIHHIGTTDDSDIMPLVALLVLFLHQVNMMPVDSVS